MDYGNVGATEPEEGEETAAETEREGKTNTRDCPSHST